MVKDFLFDDDGDIAIENGDLVAGDVTLQNILEVLESSIGYYKFDPTVGVGLSNFVNDDYTEAEIVSKIRLGMETDGAVVKSLSLDNLSLVVDATYKKKNSSLQLNNIIYSGEQTTYEVKDKQSIFDIALIVYSNVNGAFRIMAINASLIEFPPLLVTGQILQVDSFVTRKGLYTNINENLATK